MAMGLRAYSAPLKFSLATALAIWLLASLGLTNRAVAADRIRIAVSNPNMPNLTSQMALKRGFFKDENLDAEIIRMNPNVAITALATGDIDYCQLFGAVVGGAVSGLPVRIVAGFLDNWPMTLIAQPEIKTLKDLKGKTLGISSFGATPDVAARMMIKQAGIDSDKEIKILALGSDAARMTALMQRIVDVVVMSPPAGHPAGETGL
jgi:NitT/TauT family transport system substrate-binding protein